MYSYKIRSYYEIERGYLKLIFCSNWSCFIGSIPKKRDSTDACDKINVTANTMRHDNSKPEFDKIEYRNFSLRRDFRV